MFCTVQKRHHFEIYSYFKLNCQDCDKQIKIKICLSTMYIIGIKITKTQNLYLKKSSEMNSANGNTTLNRN